jgi:hypothetical protein
MSMIGGICIAYEQCRLHQRTEDDDESVTEIEMPLLQLHKMQEAK